MCGWKVKYCYGGIHLLQTEVDIPVLSVRNVGTLRWLFLSHPALWLAQTPNHFYYISKAGLICIIEMWSEGRGAIKDKCYRYKMPIWGMWRSERQPGKQGERFPYYVAISKYYKDNWLYEKEQTVENLNYISKV